MRLTGSQAIAAILLGLMISATIPAWSQESNETPSLGEVARRLKAKREKEKQKPVAVYTNDNLPTQGSLGIATFKPTEGAKEKQPSKNAGTVAAGPGDEHDEKYFRSKADKIRARMELHQRQLAVLQQELGLGKMQYYPNPQKTLEQESTPAFQSDVDKLRSKIAETQNEIADDQKAMDDLQQELRREGGDPGWIR
jgi:hypothetical protein